MRRWMKRHKILTGLVALLLALAVCVRLAWYFYVRQHYMGLIPAKLEIVGTLVVDGENRLFSGCGVAAYWLSDETLAAIEEKGLSFFDDVRNARNIRKGIHTNYHKWHVTPIPKRSAEGHPFIGMSCADSMTGGWKEKIYAASDMQGSYYSFDAAWGTLMVIPKLKIVILDYYD